jgi:hypothetical protein
MGTIRQVKRFQLSYNILSFVMDLRHFVKLIKKRESVRGEEIRHLIRTTAKLGQVGFQI